MNRLVDRVLVVAGAGRGIGAECAYRLANEGASVVAGDFDLASAESTVERITADGGSAIAVQYDQRDEASIRALVQSAVDTYGGLHGLHANAADFRVEITERDTDLLHMSAEIWDVVLRTNLTGYALLIRETLPHLLTGGGGAIVCTSSAGDILGRTDHVAYAASKAGVGALVRHVATRYGKDGIRANAVAPGVVRTPAFEETMSEEFKDSALGLHRSDRLGMPADIAAAVAFLLSDDGSWVTGQVWGVDGGMVFRS